MLHNVAMDDLGAVAMIESAMQQLCNFRRQHAPVASAVAPESAFELPPETSWSQVRIKFVDQHSIRVSVLGQSRAFHYSQLGMANSRNAEPTKQWVMLQKYAEQAGLITWQSTGASANVKKQTQELNKKLRAALAIDGVPIEYDKEASGYRTVFSIEGDS